jgi:hypothetical protein
VAVVALDRQENLLVAILVVMEVLGSNQVLQAVWYFEQAAAAELPVLAATFLEQV